MLDPTIARPQEFRVGSVLGRSVSLWLGSFPHFMVLAVLVYLPLIVYTVSVPGGMPSQGEGVTSVLGMPLNMLLTAVVVVAVRQRLRDQPIKLGECLLVGLKRLVPVLLVGLLMMLGIMGVALGAGLLLFFLPVVNTIVALVLVSMAYLVMCVAVPVVVVERPGIVGALHRSAELTKGNRLRILAVLVVTMLIVLAALFSLGMVGALIAGDSDDKLLPVLSLAGTLMLGSLWAVVTAVVYHDLRAAKEGVSVDELARVFE